MFALATPCVIAPARALAQEEVPFITTPDHVTIAMLEMAGVRTGDIVIDLGSGDGRIVITAAKTFGARGLGVEIVPELVERSRVNARKAGVAERAEFREHDLFKTDLSQASVVTMYLLPEVNLQLRPSILALKAGTRIVSHDWDMGDWLPDRTRIVAVPDKKVGLEKLSRLHLWTVPAKVDGRWCGVGAKRGWTFELMQEFQVVQGHLTAAQPSSAALPQPSPMALQGRMQGLNFVADDGLAMRLQVATPARAPVRVPARAPAQGAQPAVLAVILGSGPWSALAGARFTAAGASRCPV